MSIFGHRSGIENFCGLFSTHPWTKAFVSDAWPVPATYQRPCCEHCDQKVGRSPYRARASIKTFLAEFFLGQSWPSICPGIFFSGFSESLQLFSRRFVLIASGTEIVWRVSLNFKLFWATSLFHCHQSWRKVFYLHRVLVGRAISRYQVLYSSGALSYAFVLVRLIEISFIVAIAHNKSITQRVLELHLQSRFLRYCLGRSRQS